MSRPGRGRATFIDWDGVEFEFPKFEPDNDELREHGYVLRRVSQTLDESRYELSTHGEPTMTFVGDRFDEVLPLVGMRDDQRELSFEYDHNCWLVGVVDRALGSTDIQRYQLSHDHQGRIVAIHELGQSPTARLRVHTPRPASSRPKHRPRPLSRRGTAVLASTGANAITLSPGPAYAMSSGPSFARASLALQALLAAAGSARIRSDQIRSRKTRSPSGASEHGTMLA